MKCDPMAAHELTLRKVPDYWLPDNSGQLCPICYHRDDAERIFQEIVNEANRD